MTFNSISFIPFISLVFIIYYCLPSKAKMPWLLLSSYAYYATWNSKYVLILLLATLITYYCGILIEKSRETGKVILTKASLCIVILLGMLTLFIYKYLEFIFTNLNKITTFLHINHQFNSLELILPIGISFYILQSIGYIIDVYRGDIKAEHNIIAYGLFMSFFPQLTSGPIGRANNLLPQYKKTIIFDYVKIRDGLLTFAYGLFLKMVVADNISAYVSPIFAVEKYHNGMELLLAALLFSFQIYCDFYGYSLMAVGCGRIFQIDLMLNFKQPYCQYSIKSFWRCWHISLTSWFTDYIYKPLGGSRKGTVRKLFNTMIVFLISGLWHGAAWHYIVWGGINGVLLAMESILTNPSKSLASKLNINCESRAYKIIKACVLYYIMTLTWIFFKSDSLSEALRILKKIILLFRPGWFFGSNCYNTFDSPYQLFVLLISILVVVIVDICCVKKVNIKALIFSQQTVIRWLVYLLLIYIIMCWGAYGEGFEQTQFIYFEF